MMSEINATPCKTDGVIVPSGGTTKEATNKPKHNMIITYKYQGSPANKSFTKSAISLIINLHLL